MADALKVDGLSRLFGSSIVLRDVNLEIKENDVVGVVGENGSGKSTLLRCLTGIYRPTLGTVQARLEGTDFEEVYERRRRFKEYCGLGSQTPSYYPMLTVRENVAYFAAMHGVRKSLRAEHVQDLVSKLKLSSKLDDQAKNLSGGMKKRLDICCAVVHNPRYVFLDEPAADLDPNLRDEIWRFLLWLKKRGATVVFTTHHVNDISPYVDSVVILHDGTVTHKGAPHELGGTGAQSKEVEITFKNDEDAAWFVEQSQLGTERDGTKVYAKFADDDAFRDHILDTGAFYKADRVEVNRVGMRRLLK
jgi:ABC-2 type transport system ATP-binding protein